MKALTLTLDNLCFDPNNYRLRTHPDYKHVNKKNEISPAIQKRTYNLIAGVNNYEIIDLIESIKANGFLRVDQILVRKIEINIKNNGEDKYIVIEGNRRLAALKYLYDQHKNKYDTGKVDTSIFKEGIEVVLYEYKNDMDYLVLMGLKHVSGNKKWETYNQARLLYELKTKGYSSLEIAKKIGIEKPDVERLLRGFYAIEDFIEEVKSENIASINPHDKFMIFVELTNKSNLKKWIGWDDKNYKITNKKNKKRFFSWLVPSSEYDEENEKKIPHEPIIVNHKQVRILDDIITDEDILKDMEEYGDFDLAVSESSSYSQKKFAKSLKNIEKALNGFSYGYISNFTEDDIKTLKRIKKIIDGFLKNLN